MLRSCFIGPTPQWLFGLGRREEPEVRAAILTLTPEVLGGAAAATAAEADQELEV